MDKPDVDFIEGLSPGGLDRPEVDEPQPALDGRHDHRGLRLPAPALRPRRRAALPGLRARHRAADARSRSSTRCSRCRRAPASRCSPRSSATRKGEFVDLFATLQTKGYSRVLGRRHGAPAQRAADAEEAGEARHRGGRRPAGGQGDRQAAAHRLGGDRAAAGRRAGRARLRRPARTTTRTASAASPSAWPARTTHPLTLDDLEPRSFSFNSPYGACPECTGLGTRKEVDPELVVPDPELSLAEGAIAPWAGGQSAEYFGRLLDGLGLGRRVPHGHPVAAAAGARRRRRSCTAPTDQVHVRYRNRYGRERVLLRRTSRASSRSSSAGTTETDSRVRAGEVRGLHARRAVPGLQGRPAQARGRWPSRWRTATRASGRSPRSRPCRWPTARRSSTAWC